MGASASKRALRPIAGRKEAWQSGRDLDTVLSAMERSLIPPRMPIVAHPWVDSSRAPLYALTFPGTTTDDVMHAFTAAREAWATQCKSPVAWVVDLSAIREATANQRRLFAEHLARFEPHDIAYNCGSALIVPSAVLRGIVTAVFWIKPPKFPNQLFEKREDALVWATKQLRAEKAK